MDAAVKSLSLANSSWRWSLKVERRARAVNTSRTPVARGALASDLQEEVVVVTDTRAATCWSKVLLETDMHANRFQFRDTA